MVKPAILIGACIMTFSAIMPATAQEAPMNAHQFTFSSIDGGDFALSQYRGKAVLVVNTASFCGFTRQYTALQALWSQRREQGLVVLGVPSGDFGGQEYESEAEIKDFCDVNFDVDFPMTTREKVSGADAHPFYQWARAELGEDQAPKWNFHKYLVGPNGDLVASFATRVTPDDPVIWDAIDIALSRP